jgi:hypothetical protein
MIFLEGDNRKFGIFLSLLFSIAAAILAFLNWREEER